MILYLCDVLWTDEFELETASTPLGNFRLQSFKLHFQRRRKVSSVVAMELSRRAPSHGVARQALGKPISSPNVKHFEILIIILFRSFVYSGEIREKNKCCGVN